MYADMVAAFSVNSMQLMGKSMPPLSQVSVSIWPRSLIQKFDGGKGGGRLSCRDENDPLWRVRVWREGL